ncbi:Retrovirus-related Pol polyprotein from transposon TNT 1-94-like protein [Drosera capensis]
MVIMMSHCKEYSIAIGRTRREIKALVRYGHENDLVAYALHVVKEMESSEPSSYKEAIMNRESNQWIAVMGEEIESLCKKETWELVKLTRRRQVYNEKEGVDYNEIFSPVVRHTSIRVLLAMTASQNLELEQLEVKTAFLHGDLEEVIYMRQAEGSFIEGKEDYVCRLHKSLYGLKQSPKQWYKRFDSFMMKHGFNKSPYDYCIYHKKVSHGSLMYLLLYVDDMLIATRDMVEIMKLKVLLNTEFDMKDLGAAQKILS